MQRYAMIGPDGRPRRIVSGTKPHQDALPVEYPQLSESRVTHDIIQRAFQEWDVQADKVVVTYDIQPKSLANERENKLRALKAQRDSVIQKGITVDINGETLQIPMDEITIARVDQASLDAERRPTNWKKRWKLDAGVWRDMTPEQIEAIRSQGADHVEAAFTNEETIEGQILAASTLQELADVDIRTGWPEG